MAHRVTTLGPARNATYLRLSEVDEVGSDIRRLGKGPDNLHF